MQTTTPKGRSPSAADTMPAFMKEATTRTTRELPMTLPTSKAIDEYIEWSTTKMPITKPEALFKFVDHVLGEFIRRDRAWQAEKNSRPATTAPTSGPPDETSPGTIVSPPPRPEKGGPAPGPAGRSEARGASAAAGAAGKAG